MQSQDLQAQHNPNMLPGLTDGHTYAVTRMSAFHTRACPHDGAAVTKSKSLT